MNLADGWNRQDMVHPAIIPCPYPPNPTLNPSTVESITASKMEAMTRQKCVRSKYLVIPVQNRLL
jgi:hypothetical protein